MVSGAVITSYCGRVAALYSRLLSQGLRFELLSAPDNNIVVLAQMHPNSIFRTGALYLDQLLCRSLRKGSEFISTNWYV